jgi:hypothetical protein
MRSAKGRAAVRTAAIAAIAAMATSALPGAERAAAADADFKTYAGRWVGSGTIKLAGGTSESLKCRATYFVVSGGSGLEQNIRCASASYKLEVRSAMQQSGGAISGSWQETQYNTSGSLSGKATASGLKLSVSSDKFSASMSVTLNGSSQTVSIVPKGIDISSVTIGLKKG